MEASHDKAGDLRPHNAPAHMKRGGGAAHAQSNAGRSARSGSSGSSGRPTSFAGHYGQLILADGVAPIPRALYFYQDALNLSPQQVWFISYVFSHKWDEDLPHPRLQELARHATLGLRQIKNIKNSLVEAGLLEVTPRYDVEGAQDANSYDFGPLLDSLEKLLLSDPTIPGDELAEGPAWGEPAGGEIYDYRQPGDNATGATSSARRAIEGGRRDYSFAARYGRIVLRRGVAAIPRALFTYQGALELSPQQLWFIGYILSFQWSTELPYPSLRKMARSTGYSERQIHRIKDDLVRAGYLRVIERRGADGRDTTSAYDFSELFKTLNTLLRKETLDARVKPPQAAEQGEAGSSQPIASGFANQMAAGSLTAIVEVGTGGEIGVSGGVKGTSAEGEPDVSESVKCMTERGVKPMSVGRGKCTSYEVESLKEEASTEKEEQQQPDEMNEDQERAYYALLDVGVIPNIALEIVTRLTPDHIVEWVRYFLSVLSRQKNLDNPLGVLVKRLRSGDEPPYLPSPADLQSLRLQMSRFNF